MGLTITILWCTWERSKIKPVLNSLHLIQLPFHPPVITPAISTASRMPQTRGCPHKIAPTIASVPDLPSVQDPASDGSESAGSGRPASRIASDANSAVSVSSSRIEPAHSITKLITARGRPLLQNITPVHSNTILAPRPRGRPRKFVPSAVPASALPPASDFRADSTGISGARNQARSCSDIQNLIKIVAQFCLKL